MNIIEKIENYLSDILSETDETLDDVSESSKPIRKKKSKKDIDIDKYIKKYKKKRNKILKDADDFSKLMNYKKTGTKIDYSLIDNLIEKIDNYLSDDISFEDLYAIFEDCEDLDALDDEELLNEYIKKKVKVNRSQRRKAKKSYRKNKSKIKRQQKKRRRSAEGKRYAKKKKRMAKRGKTAGGKRQVSYR